MYIEGQEKTWHKALVATAGDEQNAKMAEAGMVHLAQRAGIPTLQYGVQTCWQPLNSQRMLLWAARQGSAEEYMRALGRKHFEEARSASHTWNVLDAAEEAGLDRAKAQAFIESDELLVDVWKSYGTTIREKGIHAIPYFVFNSPVSDAGLFRTGRGTPHEVQGSAGEEEFLNVFECILAEVDRVASAM